MFFLLPEMRHTLDKKLPELRVGEQSGPAFDPFVETGVAPQMDHLIDAAVHAAEVANAIAEMIELDRQSFRRIDPEEFVKHARVRLIHAHFNEIGGIPHICHGHEWRWLEQSIRLAPDHARDRGAKGPPAGMGRKASAAIHPIGDVGVTPHLDQPLLRSDLDKIDAGAISEQFALDRPTFASVSIEIGVEVMRYRVGDVERCEQCEILLGGHLLYDDHTNGCRHDAEPLSRSPSTSRIGLPPTASLP